MQATPRNARIDVEDVDHVATTIGPSAEPRIATKERTERTTPPPWNRPEPDSHTRNSFSLWRRRNDKFSSERNFRSYRIRNEALYCDAFDDLAGTFELGFVFEAYAKLA
ncbi:hypothetical protein ACVWXO_000385 [Bradyrhizobium sp. LM2.7]